jgi:CheY-like chemotaxis protein
VIVTDIVMPDDAYALQPAGVIVPIIAVTAFRERREELFAEGFAAVLAKPVDPLELCQVIQKQTGRT